MANFISKRKTWLLTVLYAFVLFLLNFIRIFDNNFWGDEAYTIRLAQMSIPDMIAETAADVHPPLYYILVKFTALPLGYHGAVFHFASLLPYFVSMALALTVLWKQCGKITSILFLTLASISPNAVQYNVEVRMYSWGALFVLLSYLFLRQILSRHRISDYAGFVLFSLAAAYTHYYCLVSVAFFYVALIVVSLLKNEIRFKSVLSCCLVAVAGYLPWFFTLLQTFARTSNDFWMMWIPTIKECIAFIFSGSCWYLLSAMLIISLIAFILYQLYSSKTADSCGCPSESIVHLWKLRMSADVIWVAAGAFSLFGTALAGIAVSRLIRPLFIVRYLYPVSVIAWLILGFCISRMKGRRLFAAIALVMVFISGIPPYLETYRAERSEDIRLQESLDAAVQYISADTVILTDLAQIDWTVSDYYFPGVPHQLISPEALPDLTPGTEYLLILGTPLSENVSAWLSSNTYFCEQLISDGILGTSAVFIYRAYPG